MDLSERGRSNKPGKYVKDPNAKKENNTESSIFNYDEDNSENTESTHYTNRNDIHSDNYNDSHYYNNVE